MKENQNLGIEQFEAMLQSDPDNIEDLPDYCNPLGTYEARIANASVGQTGGEPPKPKIQVTLELGKPAEELPAGEEPVTEGSLASQGFVDEFGLKKFKKVFGHLMSELNCSTLAELIEQLPETEVLVTFSRRQDKEDETKFYSDIRQIVLA